METPTRSVKRMPKSFRAHRQHIVPCDAFDDSDGLASPTARKSGAPRTPSLPSSPSSSSPAPVERPAFGRRLTFEKKTIGLSDYEDETETDAEVERTADAGICAIMFTGTNVLNNGRSPFKTPIVGSGAGARRRGSVKRRLTDSGGNVQLGPKKAKVQPNTPVESAATNMLLKQTNSMRRLSLRDDNHDSRRSRKTSSSPSKSAPLRRAISIFESSTDTPVAPHFSPFSTQSSPPVIARPNFHHQREPSQGTILFGGPSILAAQVMPMSTFSSPVASREMRGDEPSSSSIGLLSSPTPLRRGLTVTAPPQPTVTVQPAPDALMDESPIKKKFRRSSAGTDLARLIVSPHPQGSLIDNGTIMTPTSATVMTPTSAAIDNFSPLAAETSWPMLASRERRDVAKQRRSSAAAHKVSPLKKPMPGTPVKRGGATFARQWLTTSKQPDRTDAFASRKSLPMSFPNLAFASNTSTPSSKSGESVEGDDEEASPSLRPLARRQSGRQQPNTRASIGGPPLDGRRTTQNFGAIPMLLSGDDTTSSSSEEDDGPRFARPLPPRRRHDSSSDASDDEDMGVGSPSHGLSRVSTTPTSRTTRVSVQTPCHEFLPATPSQTHGTALGLVGLGFTPAKSPSVSRETVQAGEIMVDAGRLERCYMDFAELGRGEFGCVLKARRRVDGLPCAIKRSKAFEGAKHRLRVREEADILRRLSQVGRCVNVLQFHTAWEQDAQLHIETELCVYGSFAVFLSDYGSIRERLDEARVWKVVADVGEGLRFVHAAGFIHLDIKPANILVGDDARLRIADFGMASAWPPASHDGSDANDFEREGDRVYMAPEVLQGVYGPAADVFSFGLVVLEAATNIVVPDSGDAWHKLRSEDLSGVEMSTLSEPLRQLVQVMMSSHPDDRPTMEQVYAHPVVSKVRAAMDAVADLPGMAASPLHPEPDSFLEAVLRDYEDA